MIYDLLIVGGSAAGISCAMILGSASKKVFVTDRKIALIAHQKASALQDGIYNNAYGIPPGTLGSDLLKKTLLNVKENFPIINCIEDEKVVELIKNQDDFNVITNKGNTFTSKIIVIATGNASMTIKGLEEYVIPHQKSIPEKNRIQLKNIDHKVAQNLYVAGTLAGHRSQLSIATGSGAMVATDILVVWNNGNETHVHDSVKKN